MVVPSGPVFVWLSCASYSFKFLFKSYVFRSPSLANASLTASPSVTTVFGSSSHVVKSHESWMPVLVTEAVTMADGKANSLR